MSRALTPAPTDKAMWRKLLRSVHPDAGGEHDLFIWTRALFEHVAGDAAEPPPRGSERKPPQHPTAGDRVDYELTPEPGAFRRRTEKAVAMAADAPTRYGKLLLLLGGCEEAPSPDTLLYRQQQYGATYKQLAYIAHLAGLSPDQRYEWYEIAKGVPLAQRHAGHIIGKLQGGDHNFYA